MKIDFALTDFGQEEKDAVNKVLATNWLASGSENEAFEKEFAEYVGTKFALCVNSGSSANLLALASLKLPRGSKVLTSVCGFPTTLAPILHLGLVPILVDYDLYKHNARLDQVLEYIKEVKAVILAHTLGNPFDIELIAQACEALNVFLIEDCCEAVGTKVNGKSVGSFGAFGTFSFYPAHQITAGGMGGMIVSNNQALIMEAKSMRDWGKVWYWNEGMGDKKTNYTEDLGQDYLYYRHYCYQNVGYNFKLAEMNAAFGREQLKKLDGFSDIRRANYEYIKYGLSELDDFIKVRELPNSRIAWFGYPLTLIDGSKLNRNSFGDYLESKGIRHRPFFAGNILRHKPFSGIQNGYANNFPGADKFMKDSLFIGCHSKMKKSELDYIIKTIKEYIVKNEYANVGNS